MKTCTQCLLTKNFEEFSRVKGDKLKFRPNCKACKRLANNIYYKENVEKFRLRDSLRPRRKSSPHRCGHKRAFYHADRRARLLQATPKWLSPEHLEEIKYFYWLAKDLQWLSLETLEVDHITPLKGRNVSGLHVPWNLQILPSTLNAKKNNN